MNTDYYEGGWHRQIATRMLVYIPAGNYPYGTVIDKVEGVTQINQIMYEQLLDFVRKNEHGVLETDRTEDLKLINRLLNIIEKQIK
jgi:hypothetical protein